MLAVWSQLLAGVIILENTIPESREGGDKGKLTHILPRGSL